jgi:hypothetical protein
MLNDVDKCTIMDKNKDCEAAMDTRIYDYAYWPNFDKKIEILAQLAPEKWSFKGNTDN